MLQLPFGRRKDLVSDLDLGGVDCPLAVETQHTNPLTLNPFDLASRFWLGATASSKSKNTKSADERIALAIIRSLVAGVANPDRLIIGCPYILS